MPGAGYWILDTDSRSQGFWKVPGFFLHQKSNKDYRELGPNFKFLRHCGPKELLTFFKKLFLIESVCCPSSAARGLFLEWKKITLVLFSTFLVYKTLLISGNFFH